MIEIRDIFIPYYIELKKIPNDFKDYTIINDIIQQIEFYSTFIYTHQESDNKLIEKCNVILQQYKQIN